jgi:hypothetical protein
MAEAYQDRVKVELVTTLGITATVCAEPAPQGSFREICACRQVQTWPSNNASNGAYRIELEECSKSEVADGIATHYRTIFSGATCSTSSALRFSYFATAT